MDKDRPLKPNLDWVWRLMPSVLILGVLWFTREPVFDWAKESWQKTVSWGLVAMALLDFVQTIRQPLVPFVARLAWRLRTLWARRRVVTPIPAERTTSADQPITSLTDDQLGFAKYAYILARFIAHCDTPMTVGIHGEWGSGKTSLANMIRHFLTPRNDKAWAADEKLHQILADLAASEHNLDEQLPNELLEGLEIIDFNAWQYASAQSLWRALILRLSQRLEEKSLSVDADEWQRRLYYSVSQEAKGEIRLSSTALFAASAQALLAYLGSLVLPSTWLLLALRAIGVRQPKQFSLSSFDDLFERKKYSLMRKQMESIEEFQSALRQLVDRLLERQSGEPLNNRKVIFFIDDLDRCLPTVALEIMETIKTFLDAPGCVYVLLCDQQLLGQGVKAKFKDLFSEEGASYQRRGREYVEKIIQVSFQIPPSNRDQLKEYAERALCDLYGDREIPYFDVVYATVADNPRKVKRLCRGLEIAFDMMQLSLGRPTVPSIPHVDVEARPSIQSVDISADSPLVPREKSVAERKQEFAKVYCLQYGWPEALPLLRDYQTRGQANLPPVPASVETLDSKDDQLTAEDRNLHEAYQELTKLLSQDDLRIFSSLLVAVDWGKARVTGEGAVEQRNPDLWRFLHTPPCFATMNRADLKNYIEWSGVITVGEEGEELAGIPYEIYETSIEALDLSTDVHNALERTGITKVGEVLEMLERGEGAMLTIRNFGERSLEELKSRLEAKNFLPRTGEHPPERTAGGD
jgi:hypothetical protein